MFLKSMYGIGSDNGPSGSSNELINKPEKKPQKRDRSGFCKECNKQYSNFGKHWKTIHEKKRYGRGFCDICQKEFADLKHHIRAVHEKRNKLRTCPFCNQQIEFIHENKFFYHKQSCESKFTGIPFKCEECGNTFANSSLLNQHKKIHSEFPAYICPDCGNAFKTNSGLYIHKQSKSCPRKPKVPEAEELKNEVHIQQPIVPHSLLEMFVPNQPNQGQDHPIHDQPSQAVEQGGQEVDPPQPWSASGSEQS